MPITLFEHESVAFAWDDRSLAALERLTAQTGIEVLRATLRGRQRVLQARQHVGVVRLGSQTIQILPKIYKTEAAGARQRAREATANLLHMLAMAGNLSFRESQLAGLLQQDLDWFEVLTGLYAAHLADEWRRGPHRDYQTADDELPVLKGKLRITAHVRQPERGHRFPITRDEFTADNSLNRVFRYVVERLFGLTHHSANRLQLGELRQWMEEVSLSENISLPQASPALITRLNRRFEPLLNLARLFLGGDIPHLAAGEQDLFAFVIDMNALFEAFIVGLLLRHRSQVLPAGWIGCDLLPQSTGAQLFLARRGAAEVFRLKPDLAARQGREFPFLLDAKYKRLNTADRRLGIGEDDFYQMCVYAQRYECPRVMLVFPQTAELAVPLHERFHVHGGHRVDAATLDIRMNLHDPAAQVELVMRLRSILGALHD